jgi:hypothetical protein
VATGDILKVEASMHAPFDRSRNSDYTTSSGGGSRFLIVPIVIAIALFALAILEPKTSMWVAEAVQAEFPGSIIADDTSPQPARPAAPIRTPTDVNAGYTSSQR